MIDFLASPERASELPRADRAALLARVKALEGALLAAQYADGPAPARAARDEPLDADAIARELGISRPPFLRLHVVPRLLLPAS